MPARQQTLSLPATSFRGLVLNPSVVDANRNGAILCSNLSKLDDGRISVRPGTQVRYRKGESGNIRAIHYPFTYFYHDTDTTQLLQELLVLEMGLGASPGYAKTDVTLYRVKEATITITYVGSGTGTITISPIQTDQARLVRWNILVTANGSTVLDATYDTANDGPSSGGYLSTFVAAIHALADFNCSPASLTATELTGAYNPIDFFAAGYSVSLTNAQTTEIDYNYLEEIGDGYNPSSEHPLDFTDAAFIPPSAYNYSNVLYFAYGTYEHKYDGWDFYRSGLPQASINAIADAATGSTFAIGETYIYKLVYVRYDYRGNIIEGEDSDDTLAVASHTMTANRNITLTLNNLTAAANPNYAIRGAIVNGGQTGVTTITVDSGHTILDGDTIYFYDGVTLDYITREVTAVAATTITIAGAAVNVGDNQVISNNVRIQIWRTKNNGTDFYFIEEQTNDYLNATQTYTDGLADSSLTEPFVEQTRKHSIPPKAYYVGEHQGLRVLAGDPDNPNRVRWCLPDAPEGFPLEANIVDIKGGGLGAVTGFGTVDDDAMAVFKKFGHVLLDGSLDDLNFKTLNKANTGIGCTSFRTLTNIGEQNQLIGLSMSGPFLFAGRNPSLKVSEGISPLFENAPDIQTNGETIPDADWVDYLSGDAVSTTITRTLDRAMAINDSINKKYHLYIPAEVGVPGAIKLPVYSASKYLVFDYDAAHLGWVEYSFINRYRTRSNGSPVLQGLNRNAYAGFTLYNNDLWFGSLVGLGGDSMVTQLCKYNKPDSTTAEDYLDAAYPVFLDIHYIPFTREEGQPNAFFKPLYVLIHRFLKFFLADPLVTQDLGSDFPLTIKTKVDFKHYDDNAASTSIMKTFSVDNGKTTLSVKCVNAKARAYQIIITNENAYPQTTSVNTLDLAIPSFDLIEFIYSTPYDKQVKETKSSG